jgi:hypothetical protein
MVRMPVAVGVERYDVDRELERRVVVFSLKHLGDAVVVGVDRASFSGHVAAAEMAEGDIADTIVRCDVRGLRRPDYLHFLDRHRGPEPR